MQSRSVLINTNENWSDKRRYKINNVVNHAGGVHQNSTGSNSDPTLGIDWVLLKLSGNTTPFPKIQITATAGQTVFPLGTTALANGVLWNGVGLNDADWSQTGTSITTTFPLTAGDIFKPF